MAHRIIHDWWTECSECGGNATARGEDKHIHGGPDRGGSMGPNDERSYLDMTNGCRAPFTQAPIRAADSRGGWDVSNL